MKRSRRLHIFWIVVSIVMIAGMIIFTVLPLISLSGF